MTTTITIAFAVLLSGLSLSAQPLKVGTFNNRAVALAFYNSDVWAGVMKAKHAERASARQVGNTERVAELEKWGGEQQDLAHKQVFGSAPITNVLEYLSPGFPEIARAAGVPLVAGDVYYANSSVQRVDVTMQILDWLKSNEKTRAMVKSLLEKGGSFSEAPHKH
jgi:hypothetical protein